MKDLLSLYKKTPKAVRKASMRGRGRAISSINEISKPLDPSEAELSRMQDFSFWKVACEYNGMFRRWKKRKNVAIFCFLESGGDPATQREVISCCADVLCAFFPNVNFSVIHDDELLTDAAATMKSEPPSGAMDPGCAVNLYNADDLYGPVWKKCSSGSAGAGLFACLGVLFDSDIYPGEKGKFALGHSSTAHRVGLCCPGRSRGLSASAADALWPLAKVMTHELCHLFGLDHCCFFKCLMNNAATAREAVELPLWLCPFCLSKLRHLLRFDLRRRWATLICALKTRAEFAHRGFAEAVEHFEMLLQVDLTPT